MQNISGSFLAAVLVTGLLGTASAWGQSQLGTATSTAPFTLRDASVAPGQGIPAWPVMPGDTIKAGTARTMVTFTDGSMVTLDPGAEAKIDSAAGTPVFQLLSCSAHYSMKTRVSVQLSERGQVMPEKSLSGDISMPCSVASPAASSNGPGWWTPGRIAAVVVVGGAAAAVGGYAASANGGASVSPSH